jgi:hypothetical protein
MFIYHPVDVTNHLIVSISVFGWCIPQHCFICFIIVVDDDKNTFMNFMTTGFEQKYEHDILIQKKKRGNKVDRILKCVVYSIRQNSVNPTHIGPGRCQIIKSDYQTAPILT